PRDGCRNPSGSDLADSGVALIGNVKVAGAVDRHMRRADEARGGPRAVRVTNHARSAGERRDDPGGGDLADSLVVQVGNVHVASAVDRYVGKKTKARGGPRAVFTTPS